MRRFEMLAYTGGIMRGLLGGIIVDVDGIDTRKASYPILRQHDHSLVIGFTDSAVKGTDLRLTGNLVDDTAAGRDVATLADSGFLWQASIGFQVLEIEDILEGERAFVNGRDWPGPISIVRRAELIESSFVPLGADGDTRSVVLQPTANAAVPLRLAASRETRPNVREVNIVANRTFTMSRREWDEAMAKAEAEAPNATAEAHRKRAMQLLKR